MDNTENTHKNELQRWLAALVSSADVAIVGRSLVGEIMSWNSGAEKIYGYTAEETVGKSINMLTALEYKHEFIKIFLAKDQKKRIKHSETVRQHKNGEFIPIFVLNLPIKNQDGDIIGICEISHDIPKKKKTEKIDKKYVEKLERNNQTLERFAFMVAHDLKTPLVTIKGYSKLMLEEFAEKFNNRERESLNYVMKAVQNMDNLINSLLLLSRVTYKRARFQKIHTQQLVNKVIKDLETVLRVTNGQIKVDPLPVVKGDPTQIYSVFLNLISNAIKYNVSSSPIVQISGHVREEKYEFSIEDNGIGINPKNLKRIFDPFERVGNELKNRGTGLGLAISKRIIEGHGGVIWVQSSLKRGSIFYFTLPMVKDL